uniref:Cytochrome P450 750A1-like n=1 Tax=Elaeis guineensis var. tenera TaxID=51953 RepID=A0A6I9R0C5_ELAGV|nr:cytochrome P450 750A1-like [Elaeis guineensis]
METIPWATYLATILASILLLKTLLRSHRPRLTLPPGPKPWPIIGNLNLIGALPHRSIHALAQKYGPIMQLRFGSVPIVVASSVDMVKLFLKTHDLNFASRPKLAAGKYTTFNYSDITWSPYGPYWRQARKMCIMELFSAKRLDSYEYIRAEEMRLLLRGLHQASGRTITLKDYLSTVSLDVISRMVLGKKYLDESESESAEEFRKMIEELFLLNGVVNIGDYIPWLDFLDLQGYIKRMKELSKKFDNFLEHVLDEHKERMLREGEGFVAKDMVDVLLQQAEDPSLEVKIERHGVKAFTQVKFSLSLFSSLFVFFF